MTSPPPRRRCILFFAFCGLLASSVCAQDSAVKTGDWPCFLGPHGTGISDETDLADSWPAGGPPILWTRETGVGYSAPSILGNRLVLHHRQGHTSIIECHDAASGESLWRHTTPTDFTDPYGYNGGPRASPLLTSEFCYTLGAGGQLTCLALKTGKPVWEHDLAAEFSIPDWFFGMGCSPILYQDLLIVMVGGQPDCGVVAFNARNGKVEWHAVGKPIWDGTQTPEGETYEWTGEEMLISYATPTLAQFDSQTHLLCLVRQGLVSLDPATGKERFHYWFRSQLHDSVNAARPIVIDDKILLTAAYRTGAALLRVKDGQCEEIWRSHSNLACHWSTPILVDGLAYGFSGRHEGQATLRCVEIDTGNVLWKVDGSESVRDQLELDQFGRGFHNKATGKPAPWPFFGRGSKIRADGHFILLGERGTLALARLSREGYVELARCAVPDISYPAWTAPVLSRGRLYLRDEDTLVCLDVGSTDE